MSNVNVNILLSKMTLIRDELNILSHNLANASTSGFQRQFIPHGEFYKNHSYVEGGLPVNDISAGPLNTTENPFHVYLKGNGYFAVQTPRGVRYTRSGIFTLNSDSQLVTPTGYLVLDEGLGPIVLPEGETNIRIAADGTISDTQGIISKLGFFSFDTLSNLRREEDTLIATDQTPVLSPTTQAVQYGYEGSNVNSILETNRLMTLMMADAQVERMLEAQHKVDSETTEHLGRSMQA